MLVVIVRGCGVGGVPNEVVQEVFPRVVRRALASDDSAILQVSCSPPAVGVVVSAPSLPPLECWGVCEGFCSHLCRPAGPVVSWDPPSSLVHVSSSLPLRVDASGHSGLGYVVQLVVHLLDPARPEFSAAFVGKLIITFIKKVRQSCFHGDVIIFPLPLGRVGPGRAPAAAAALRAEQNALCGDQLGHAVPPRGLHTPHTDRGERGGWPLVDYH